MFVQSAKFIQAHSGNRGSISIYGQEANPDTWKMAIMNLTIRGLDADLGAYHADTFTNDLHPTLKADFILANLHFDTGRKGTDRNGGSGGERQPELRTSGHRVQMCRPDRKTSA